MTALLAASAFTMGCDDELSFSTSEDGGGGGGGGGIDLGALVQGDSEKEGSSSGQLVPAADTTPAAATAPVDAVSSATKKK